MKDKLIKALELYKEIFTEEKEEGADIGTHSFLKNGVGAYFNSEDTSGYAEIMCYGITYNANSKSVNIKYEDIEPVPIDLDKWLDAVITTLKVNEKQDYTISDFELEIKPVVVTNRVIDAAVVKAKLLDDLMKRNVRFDN